MLVEGIHERRRDALILLGLAVVSALAVFGLYAVSDLLHLRALATPGQKQIGRFVWLLASGLLVGIPLYGVGRRRMPLQAWVVLVPSLLLAYVAIQVLSVFGLLPPLPVGVPDLTLDGLAIFGGMGGIYASAAVVVQAVRSRHFTRLALSLFSATFGALVVILWSWVCLYFE